MMPFRDRSSLMIGALLVAAPSAAILLPGGASPGAESVATVDARRCVGMFVTSDRKSIAADSASIVVIGKIPCAERGVVAWATQGVYRAFDDGSVELLASPVPPCPGGDVFVWIRYPNP
jgi:hypothetical protein